MGNVVSGAEHMPFNRGKKGLYQRQSWTVAVVAISRFQHQVVMLSDLTSPPASSGCPAPKKADSHFWTPAYTATQTDLSEPGGTLALNEPERTNTIAVSLHVAGSTSHKGDRGYDCWWFPSV